MFTLHGDVESAWLLFLMMEMFDWKFLPSQIEAEDAQKLRNLMTIRWYVETIRRLLRKTEAD